MTRPSVALKLQRIQERLEYLRGELRAERISYMELSELQALTPHIDAADVELLEAAGVPEHPGDDWGGTMTRIEQAGGLLREAIDLLDNQETELDIRDFLKGARQFLAESATIEKAAKQEQREADQGRQTACRYCRLDIENLKVRGYFPRGGWRDRGGNPRCPDEKHFHRPAADV